MLRPMVPRIVVLALAVLVLLSAAACGSSSRKAPGKRVSSTARDRDRDRGGAVRSVQTGYATWYGGNHHGGPTASGERYNMHAMTAAHRTLKMNTRVRVTNTRNGRSVVVRINDRGPYGKKRERIIDVSQAAARRLDMIEAGVVPVRVEVLE